MVKSTVNPSIPSTTRSGRGVDGRSTAQVKCELCVGRWVWFDKSLRYHYSSRFVCRRCCLSETKMPWCVGFSSWFRLSNKEQGARTPWFTSLRTKFILVLVAKAAECLQFTNYSSRVYSLHIFKDQKSLSCHKIHSSSHICIFYIWLKWACKWKDSKTF